MILSKNKIMMVEDHRALSRTFQYGLVMLILIMGIYVHDTTYMSEHTTRFLLELVAFMVSAMILFVLLHRIGEWKTERYYRTLFSIAVIVAILAFFVELGGWLDKSSTTRKDDIVWSINILYAVSFLGFFIYAATTGDIYKRSGVFIVPTLLALFFGTVVVAILTKHSHLLHRLTSRLHLTTPPWCIGIVLLMALFTVGLFLSILVYSFRVMIPFPILRTIVHAIVFGSIALLPLLLVCHDRSIPMNAANIAAVYAILVGVYIVSIPLKNQMDGKIIKKK